jgi:hypothetical protein
LYVVNDTHRIGRWLCFFHLLNDTDITCSSGSTRRNQNDKTQPDVMHSSFVLLSEEIRVSCRNTALLNKIDVIRNVERMCYLNNILHQTFLYLPYILKRFYLYDPTIGRTLTVVSTADITNVSKFFSTFFVVPKLTVLRQCSCGIYFPNQPVT